MLTICGRLARKVRMATACATLHTICAIAARYFESLRVSTKRNSRVKRSWHFDGGQMLALKPLDCPCRANSTASPTKTWLESDLDVPAHHGNNRKQHSPSAHVNHELAADSKRARKTKRPMALKPGGVTVTRMHAPQRCLRSIATSMMMVCCKVHASRRHAQVHRQA